jgi:ketosteroid isomerase-like protein
MRRLITVGLLALALGAGSACTVYPYREAKVFTDATGGESAERAFWSAVEQKHWRAIDSCVAPNFVYVTPAGRLDRAAALAQIEKMQVEEASLGDVTTEMNGNTFVVSYTLTLHGTADGQPLPANPQHRVSVWQKQKTSWVLISHDVLGAAGT